MNYDKSRKLFIASLIFLFCCFQFVQAQEQQTLGGQEGYVPGEDIELIQICDNCTFVNITYIKLGSGSLLAINSPMNKNGVFFNYSFNGSNTNSLGEYVVNWAADPDGKLVVGNYNFYVRKGGVLLTTGEAIIYIFLMIINFLAFFFFLYMAFKIPYSSKRTTNGTLSRLISQKYLKLLSIWIGYGALLWFMNLLTGIVSTFTYLDLAYNLVSNLYLFLLILGYGLTVLVLAVMFIEFWIDILSPLFKRMLNKWWKS